MHNIYYTTGVTSNQGKQLVKSGRLGSKDKVHNVVKKVKWEERVKKCGAFV